MSAPFNPAAIELFSPGNLYWDENGKNCGATYKNGVGKYDPHFYVPSAQLAAALGVPKLPKQVTLKDLYKLVSKASYEPSRTLGMAGKSPRYRQFIEEQIEHFVKGCPQGAYSQARDDFEAMVDDLFQTILQEPCLNGCKVKVLENPRRCVALANRRTGVFVWPDWMDPSMVSVVVSCEYGEDRAVRDQVHAWMQRHSLKLSINSDF